MIQGPQTTHRIFDEHGRYEGRIDDTGRIFDEHGRCEGHIDSIGLFLPSMANIKVGLINDESEKGA